MHQNEHNRFVDDLLDAGLAQYRSVEPRPGLENRILARLRTEQKAAPWRAWAWRIGAGVVAAGVILALVSQPRRQRPHTLPSVAESPKSAPAVASLTPATAPARQTPVPRHNEPRRDVFPSPAPLSEEEKLLVSYVRKMPDGALGAFPEDDQPVASLRVPDLNIPPLEMKELPGTIADQTK